MKTAIIPTALALILTSSLASIEWLNFSYLDTKVKQFDLSEDDNDAALDSNSTQKSLPPQNSDATKYEWLERIEDLADLKSHPLFQEQTEAVQKQTLLAFARINLKSKTGMSKKIIQSLPEKEFNPHEKSFLIALCYSRLGDQERAISGYQEIINLQPNHLSARINLALIYKRQKKFDLAISLLEGPVKKANGLKKAKMLSIIGTSQIELKQYHKAFKSLKRASEYRPSHAQTWLKLAHAAAKINHDYQETISLYQRASNLASRNFRYHLEYGRFTLERLDFLRFPLGFDACAAGEFRRKSPRAAPGCSPGCG